MGSTAFFDILGTEFKYRQGGSVLMVMSDLDYHLASEFEVACGQLLNASGPEIIVDLQHVRYVCAGCLGELLFVHGKARERGLHLAVRIPKCLIDIFDLMCLRDVIDTIVIE